MSPAAIAIDTEMPIVSRNTNRRRRTGVRSALATGAAKLPAAASAGILARALREHAQNPTALKLVVLPIPDPAIYDAFARAFAAPGCDDITAMPDRGDGNIGGEPRAARNIVRSLLEHFRPRRARGSEDSPETQLISGDPALVAAVRLSMARQTSRPMLGGRYVVLEIDRFNAERSRLQSILRDALVPDPALRPSAARLGQMLRAVASV